MVLTDSVIEDYIVRKKTASDYVFRVCIIIALVIFILFFNYIILAVFGNVIYFSGMISFGIAYLVYRFVKRTNKEYELSITNEDFSIVEIVDKKKREPLAGFSIRNCEYIGQVTSDRFNEDCSKAEFTINATENRKLEINDSTWYCLVNEDNVRYVVVFPFQNKMYPVFKRYNMRHLQVVDVPQEEDEFTDEPEENN